MDSWKVKGSNKKKIDLEAEFVGLPVAPRKKKVKEPDLTDEIKNFISNPITLDSIKHILIRLYMPESVEMENKSSIKIYKFHTKNRYIMIVQTKKYEIVYYLDNFDMWHLDWFRVERISKSSLRNNLSNKIYNWLLNNPNCCVIME